MPMFIFSLRSKDRVLTPPVTVEFDGWSDVLDHAAEITLAIYHSGICDGVTDPVQLVVDSADGSARTFVIVDDGVAIEHPSKINTSRLSWGQTSSGVFNE